MQISLKGRGHCDDIAKTEVYADHLLCAVEQVKHHQPKEIWPGNENHVLCFQTASRLASRHSSRVRV